MAKKAKNKNSPKQKKTSGKSGGSKKPTAKSAAKKTSAEIPAENNIEQSPTTEPLVTVSPGFVSWLKSHNCSLLVSTYQTRRVISIGIDGNGSLALTPREFGRCMGLGVDPSGTGFWLATTYQIWRYVQVGSPKSQEDGKQVFLPQAAYTTGVLDIHDLAVGNHGRPVFYNTMFNCLSTTNENASFVPLWKPKFVTELIPEDRCHLNGLAMYEGIPRYVTLFSKTNEREGWRDDPHAGCVIDVQNPDQVVGKLSQPHSPRILGDRLWLMQSGTGEFGYVDQGKFVTVSSHAGYPRGLSFLGDHAIIGLSKDRKEGEFDELPLGQKLKEGNQEPVCGLDVVNLRTGKLDFFIRFEDTINELYDVAILPGCPNPEIVGISGDDIWRHYSIGDPQRQGKGHDNSDSPT